MGRWAQARRRGRKEGLEAGLPQPPAPTLGESGGMLTVYSQSLPDTGGTLKIWFAEEAPPGGDPVATHAWASEWEWQEISETNPGYYWAGQTGGGLEYAGDSPLSEPYEVE